MVNKKQRVIVFFLLMLLSAGAYSATVPTSTGMLYSIYDIVVLKGIGGAAGYVAGALGVAVGLARMAYGAPPIQTVATLVGSAAFIATPSIVTSLGAIY